MEVYGREGEGGGGGSTNFRSSLVERMRSLLCSSHERRVFLSSDIYYSPKKGYESSNPFRTESPPAVMRTNVPRYMTNTVNPYGAGLCTIPTRSQSRNGALVMLSSGLGLRRPWQILCDRLSPRLALFYSDSGLARRCLVISVLSWVN